MKTKYIINFLIFQIGFSLLFFGCKKDESISSGTTGQFTDSGMKIYKQFKLATNYGWQRTCFIVPEMGLIFMMSNLANAEAYGFLYNWKTACEVCPDGWHLPSDDEWKELEMFLE